MTAAKTIKMLLKKKQRMKNDENLEGEVVMLTIQSEKKMLKCSHCRKTKHTENYC